ncbi:hypothetical protein [Sorangium sp. So ce1335]
MASWRFDPLRRVCGKYRTTRRRAAAIEANALLGLEVGALRRVFMPCIAA